MTDPEPRTSRPPRLRALLPVTGLLVRNQLTRGRVVALAALGIVGIVVGALTTGASVLDPTAQGTRFVNLYALSLLTPVVALVFGAGVLGDLVEDRSLVHLWLPPVPRWVIAVGAWIATMAVCLPFTVGLGTAMAAATGGGRDLVLGTLWATTLGMIAYTGLFTALGLRFRRALIWGFAYVLIWETFIARAGAGAARLSIVSYLRSILSAWTGAGLELADRDLVWSYVVPIAVGVLAIIYTTRRLSRTDVD